MDDDAKKARQDFGLRLYDCMEKSGLTPRTLGEAVGRHQDTVYHWLYGAGYPTIPALIRLSETLGVTVDYLLKGGVKR